tara:strand:+ start:609 stop:1007 length:399 start_codon:yes stop_codon:yes gene_type:complete
MRELEFRQKLKEDAARRIGPYHYWGYMDGGFISPLGKNGTVSDSEQYLGIQDENGVKVFENDVVHIVHNKFGEGINEVWRIEYGSFGDAAYYVCNGINSCRRIDDEFGGYTFNIDGTADIPIIVINDPERLK